MKKWVTFNEGRYHGETDSSRLPHGFGKMKFTDGIKYEGYWNHGEVHGQGKMIYPGWGVFEGTFKEGYFDGPFTITGENKIVVKTTLKIGHISHPSEMHFSGTGEIQYPDRTVYNGEIGEDFAAHGQGSFRLASGLVMTGTWNGFEAVGIVRTETPNGSIIKSRLKNGSPIGKTAIYWCNGDFFQGTYSEDGSARLESINTCTFEGKDDCPDYLIGKLWDHFVSSWYQEDLNYLNYNWNYLFEHISSVLSHTYSSNWYVFRFGYDEVQFANKTNSSVLNYQTCYVYPHSIRTKAGLCYLADKFADEFRKKYKVLIDAGKTEIQVHDYYHSGGDKGTVSVWFENRF